MNLKFRTFLLNSLPFNRNSLCPMRMNRSRYYVLPFVLIFLFSCQQPVTDNKETSLQEEPSTLQNNPFENSEITVEPFKVDSMENNGSSGWGYNILIDGKLYIHQPNIPAIMGNSGFSSEEKAREAGEFIVEKIRKKILPPSVTAEELESRGLLD